MLLGPETYLRKIPSSASPCAELVLRVTHNMCRKHRAMSGPKESASRRALTPDLLEPLFVLTDQMGLASQAGSRNQETPLIGGMPDVSARRRVHGSTLPSVWAKKAGLQVNMFDCRKKMKVIRCAKQLYLLKLLLFYSISIT